MFTKTTFWRNLVGILYLNDWTLTYKHWAIYSLLIYWCGFLELGPCLCWSVGKILLWNEWPKECFFLPSLPGFHQLIKYSPLQLWVGAHFIPYTLTRGKQQLTASMVWLENWMHFLRRSPELDVKPMTRTEISYLCLGTMLYDHPIEMWPILN